MSKRIDDITAKVGLRFRTFGGGQDSNFNPLTHALKNHASMFAAGVDVREVVTFVLKLSKPKRPAPRKQLG